MLREARRLGCAEMKKALNLMPGCENYGVTLACLKQQNLEFRCGNFSKFGAILLKLAVPKPGVLSAETEESSVSLF
jgi:hypothetical protein